MPGETGKFGLGLQKRAGQWLIEFCQENALVIETPSSNNTREDSRWSTPKSEQLYSYTKNGEAVYSSKNKTGS